MIKYILLFTFILISRSANCQFITEHLIEVNKSYDPLFSVGKGDLRVSLDMTYRDGGPDSLLYVVVAIEQLKASVIGTSKSVSVGGSSVSSSWGVIGGLAGAFSSNKTYAFNNTLGTSFLSYNQLDSLLKDFIRLKEFGKVEKGFGKTVLFKVGKVMLGLDMTKKGTVMEGFTLSKRYYIQIDESAFNLSESEFTDLYENAFKAMKETWDYFKNYHTIQTPIN